jgi:ribosomal protein S18 acetylase RimI-like enzyme
MEIRRATEVSQIVAASTLFDHPARPDWSQRFLGSPGHHLLLAYVDGMPAGMVTGVEMTHPDKGTEMFLYELGVDGAYRGRGIGRALVTALAEVARERGCYGMWVLTEDDNAAALATYRAAGASDQRNETQLSWTFAQD